MMPAPVIEAWGQIRVVRDDLIAGGTKRRVLEPYFAGIDAAEFVYASPACGYAQVAIAQAAAAIGRQATIFTARRRVPHALTRAAMQAGAAIKPVRCGYLSNVQAKARIYCKQTGAHLLPFGLHSPEFIRRLAAVAAGINIDPPEVWAVAGSGTLTCALQTAWPDAKHYAVHIGAKRYTGRAAVFTAPERFEKPAQHPPPFPSCANYDAKAWRFIQAHARPGALFWNVAA